MPADSVLEIKVTLAGLRPPIWRRLLVPADLTLDRLHLVSQTVMGWENYHMNLFQTSAGDYGRRDSELGHREARKVPLYAVAPAVGDKITCTYDFGDDWVHHIEVEKALPQEPGTAHPRCLPGPPEDWGGPWGYANFLESHHRPRARGARRTPGMDRRLLRPQPVRRRGHQQAPCRPVASGGTSAAQH